MDKKILADNLHDKVSRSILCVCVHSLIQSSCLRLHSFCLHCHNELTSGVHGKISVMPGMQARQKRTVI